MAVGGDGGVEGGFGLGEGGLAASGVIEGLGDGRADGEEAAGPTEPAGDAGVLEADAGAESEGGIKGRRGDSDLFIGGGHLAFGGGDIGAAFEQRRGHADGNGRRRVLEREGGDIQFGGGLAGEHRDGVFVLRAGDSEVLQLRLGGVELRFGLGHIQIAGDAAGVTVLRERQVLLIVLHGAFEQGTLAVLPVKQEVVLGEQGLVKEAAVFELGGGCLSGGGGSGDAAADVAPQIWFPGGAEGKAECRVHAAGIGDGVGGARFGDGGAGTDSGREGRLGDIGGGAGFAELGFGEEHVLVIDGDALFEGVERGVFVNLPPFAFGRGIAGSGWFPALDLFEFRRRRFFESGCDGRGGAFIGGAHDARCCEEESGGENIARPQMNADERGGGVGHYTGSWRSGVSRPRRRLHQCCMRSK